MPFFTQTSEIDSAYRLEERFLSLGRNAISSVKPYPEPQPRRNK